MHELDLVLVDQLDLALVQVCLVLVLQLDVLLVVQQIMMDTLRNITMYCDNVKVTRKKERKKGANIKQQTTNTNNRQ